MIQATEGLDHACLIAMGMVTLLRVGRQPGKNSPNAG